MGELAQLARASALQAEGQRFESVILHVSATTEVGGRARPRIRPWGEIFDIRYIQERLREKLEKSTRGMPKLLEAKKDVTSCENPRGLAHTI